MRLAGGFAAARRFSYLLSGEQPIEGSYRTRGKTLLQVAFTKCPGMHAASALPTILRVDNFVSATVEIISIAGRKRSSSHLANANDVRILLGNRLALPSFPFRLTQGWLPPNHGLSHPKRSLRGSA